MSTTTPTSQESIDAEPTVEPRTRRAIEGCMVVVPEGDTTGLFDVYSANNGHNEIYTVDLREGRCTCPDAEYNLADEEACKHERRVKLALGIMDLPADPTIEIDGVLAHSREKYGASPASGAHTPASAGGDTTPAAGKAAVATDGGQLIEAPDDGVILDSQEDDEEEEKDNDDDARELRSATHTIALDAYDASPLPDFDVFGEIVACSADSVRRASEAEAGQ